MKFCLASGSCWIFNWQWNTSQITRLCHIENINVSIILWLGNQYISSGGFVTSGATNHPLNFPLKIQLKKGEFSITKLHISLVFSLQFILLIYGVLTSVVMLYGSADLRSKLYIWQGKRDLNNRWISQFLFVLIGSARKTEEGKKISLLFKYL